MRAVVLLALALLLVAPLVQGGVPSDLPAPPPLAAPVPAGVVERVQVDRLVVLAVDERSLALLVVEDLRISEELVAPVPAAAPPAPLGGRKLHVRRIAFVLAGPPPDPLPLAAASRPAIVLAAWERTTAGWFLQSDPILGNRASEHYGYAAGNPVSNTDPMGLFTVEGLFAEFEKQDSEGKYRTILAKAIRGGWSVNKAPTKWWRDNSYADAASKILYVRDISDREAAAELIEQLDEEFESLGADLAAGMAGAVSRSIKEAEAMQLEGFESAWTDIEMRARSAGSFLQTGLEDQLKWMALGLAAGKTVEWMIAYRDLRNARKMVQLEKTAEEAARGSVWRLGPGDRGVLIEKRLGQNLPGNYPVIDVFRGGTAASIKSADLSLKSYQKAAYLESQITRYIDDVARFQGDTWAGVSIKAGEIKNRSVFLAIPYKGASAEQLQVLNRMIQYGEGKGVKLTIFEFE